MQVLPREKLFCPSLTNCSNPFHEIDGISHDALANRCSSKIHQHVNKLQQPVIYQQPIQSLLICPTLPKVKRVVDQGNGHARLRVSATTTPLPQQTLDIAEKSHSPLRALTCIHANRSFVYSNEIATAGPNSGFNEIHRAFPYQAVRPVQQISYRSYQALNERNSPINTMQSLNLLWTPPRDRVLEQPWKSSVPRYLKLQLKKNAHPSKVQKR